MRNSIWAFAIPFILSCSTSFFQEDPNRARQIRNGDVIEANEIDPYQFAVRLVLDTSGVCSGSLIRPNVILTAGHCLDGAFDIRVRANKGGATSAMRSGILHPDFQFLFPSFNDPDQGVITLPPVDIALLELNDRFDYVPAGLHTANIGTSSIFDIVGFGKERDDFPTFIKRSGTSVFSKLIPLALDPILRLQDHGILALAGGNNTQTCGGDSGGPVLLGNQIAGVNSASEPGAKGSCDLQRTDSYVRVAPFVDWINQEADRMEQASSTSIIPSEPARPTQIVAIAVSSTQINLSWADNSQIEQGYRIILGDSYCCPAVPPRVVASLPANSTSFSATGLQFPSNYSFQVIAFNGQGDSMSDLVSAAPLAPPPPAAPSQLQVLAMSDSQIGLNWIDNSNNETGFEIERKIQDGTFSLVRTVVANSTSNIDFGLSDNTTYVYRIRAVNQGGRSAYANEASATTPIALPPAAPSALSSSVISANRIELSWTDNSNNETAFRIERKEGTGAFAEIASVGENIRLLSDNGLRSNTRYVYRVRAVRGTQFSNYSNESSTATPQVPPAVPAGLTARGLSRSSIELTWSDNSNNEEVFQIFEIRRRNRLVLIRTVGANISSFTHSGLKRNSLHSYKIKARNSAGESAFSNMAVARTNR